MSASSSTSSKPIVLSLLGAFWPDNDASGPNQSYKAMAQALGHEFDFRLVARDRPFGSLASLAAQGQCTQWLDLGFCQARYLAPGRLGANGLCAVLRDTPYDVLWLNGFFDREFTIPALVMRANGRIACRPVILSPRGEFASGALGLKSLQKHAYLALCRRSALLNRVTLHATSGSEAELIRSTLSSVYDVATAGNVRALIEPAPRDGQNGNGTLRLAFVGRIARVKNLDFALRVLMQTRTRLQFDIYGPVHEPDYWVQCQELIGKLPGNIIATHHGELSNHAIPAALARADMLFLPTTGENFGHAIFEALSCAVPVLISDTTPWRGLAAIRAGWDLPLQDPTAFAAVIDAYLAMSEAERWQLQRGARAAAEAWVRETGSVATTRAMLWRALDTHAQTAQATA